jgi:hypothetical protein
VEFSYSNDGSNDKLIITAKEELFVPTTISFSASNNGKTAECVANIGLPASSISLTHLSGPNILSTEGDVSIYQCHVAHPVGDTT